MLNDAIENIQLNKQKLQSKKSSIGFVSNASIYSMKHFKETKNKQIEHDETIIDQSQNTMLTIPKSYIDKI